MKIEKMSIEELRKEIEDTKSFIEDLCKTMECIPSGSILGRLSVRGAIKSEEKRLERLETELSKRRKEKDMQISEKVRNK